ncbi:MAG: hypothetical protein IBX64_03120 [Actinobacteria bacterium]|nr:hypothetical protein [Actinomycetota bacterium]
MLIVTRKYIGILLVILGGLTWLGLPFGYKASQILPIHLILVFTGLGFKGSSLLEHIRQQRS